MGGVLPRGRAAAIIRELPLLFIVLVRRVGGGPRRELHGLDLAADGLDGGRCRLQQRLPAAHARRPLPAQEGTRSRLL